MVKMYEQKKDGKLYICPQYKTCIIICNHKEPHIGDNKCNSHCPLRCKPCYAIEDKKDEGKISDKNSKRT